MMVIWIFMEFGNLLLYLDNIIFSTESKIKRQASRFLSCMIIDIVFGDAYFEL